MAGFLGGYPHTGQGRQSRKSVGIALKSRQMRSGLKGAAVVALGANQAAARKWICSDWLFFSWEQENEERQPSKGHFSGDQEMILQIYGLRGGGKEELSALLCALLLSGATFLKAACSKSWLLWLRYIHTFLCWFSGYMIILYIGVFLCSLCVLL